MMCDKCGKQQATSYYKQTINGKSVSMNLCSDCAQKLGGFNNIFSDPFGISNLFSDFLFPIGETGTIKSIVCEKCSKTFEEITEDGKIGCDNCYVIFRDKLLPSIERLHGNATNVGKVPHSAGAEIKRKKQLDDLKAELEDAVKKEDFEKAATLRDKIKSLSKDDNKGGEIAHE